jgi:cobalamin biosynthesis protein CobD/CbiB|tara:strand:+ start:1085 stop:1276 length:192 start_codon:yes stop_codon:yes gene_type:complete
MKKYKIGLIQAVIVLVPTYFVAYLTDKMVYTIPMLAAASFIAASFSKDTTTKRIDDISKEGKD